MPGRPVLVRFLRQDRAARHQLSAAAGGPVDLGTVPARRMDVSDADRETAGIEYGRAVVRFRVRDDAVTASVKVGDLARTGDGEFEVIGKTELPGLRRGFEVMAEARSDV